MAGGGGRPTFKCFRGLFGSVGLEVNREGRSRWREYGNEGAWWRKRGRGGRDGGNKGIKGHGGVNRRREDCNGSGRGRKNHNGGSGEVRIKGRVGRRIDERMRKGKKWALGQKGMRKNRI